MRKIKRIGSDASDSQKIAMEIVDVWAHTEKTPIPRGVLFKELILRDIPDATVDKTIRNLVKKGFLRRTTIGSNKVAFVQLRRI